MFILGNLRLFFTVSTSKEKTNLTVNYEPKESMAIESPRRIILEFFLRVRRKNGKSVQNAVEQHAKTIITYL